MKMDRHLRVKITTKLVAAMTTNPAFSKRSASSMVNQALGITAAIDQKTMTDSGRYIRTEIVTDLIAAKLMLSGSEKLSPAGIVDKALPLADLIDRECTDAR